MARKKRDRCESAKTFFANKICFFLSLRNRTCPGVWEGGGGRSRRCVGRRELTHTFIGVEALILLLRHFTEK